MPEDPKESTDSFVHFNGKNIPCGIARTKGLLVTGDPALVTCSGCAAAISS